MTDTRSSSGCAVADLRSILDWRGQNGLGHQKMVLSRSAAEEIMKALAAPNGFVSVELLNLERGVSDDLREQNAQLRDTKDRTPAPGGQAEPVMEFPLDAGLHNLAFPEPTQIARDGVAQCSLERDSLAETIHNARWPADRQLAATPFADEDRSGREYCYRIADAILNATPANRSTAKATANVGDDRESMEAQPSKVASPEAGSPSISSTDRP